MLRYYYGSIEVESEWKKFLWMFFESKKTESGNCREHKGYTEFSVKHGWW